MSKESMEQIKARLVGEGVLTALAMQGSFQVGSPEIASPLSFGRKERRKLADAVRADLTGLTRFDMISQITYQVGVNKIAPWTSARMILDQQLKDSMQADAIDRLSGQPVVREIAYESTENQFTEIARERTPDGQVLTEVRISDGKRRAEKAALLTVGYFHERYKDVDLALRGEDGFYRTAAEIYRLIANYVVEDKDNAKLVAESLPRMQKAIETARIEEIEYPFSNN